MNNRIICGVTHDDGMMPTKNRTLFHRYTTPSAAWSQRAFLLKSARAAILLFFSLVFFIFFSTVRYCTSCAYCKKFSANKKRRQTFLSIAYSLLSASSLPTMSKFAEESVYKVYSYHFYTLFVVVMGDGSSHAMNHQAPAALSPLRATAA